MRDRLHRCLPPENRARPVLPENLHLTLLFLGSVPAGLIDDLCIGAHTVATQCGQLSMQLNRFGCWTRPGIVWLAPVPAPARLVALAHHLRDMAQELNLPLEKRPYKPHVTLLRGYRPSDRITPECLTAPSLPAWPVHSFTLMESRPDAPYAAIKRWQLAK